MRPQQRRMPLHPLQWPMRMERMPRTQGIQRQRPLLLRHRRRPKTSMLHTMRMPRRRDRSRMMRRPQRPWQ